VRKIIVETVLTDKRKMFCSEYMVDMNATQAAIRAGYSKKTARQQGQRLLTNVDIKETIKRYSYIKKYRTYIKADHILSELKRIAFEVDTDDKNFKYGDKIRALEILAKHYGLFEKKAEKPKRKHIRVTYG